MIRPALFNAGAAPAFLHNKGTVSALVGHGNHAGWLRLEPKGSFTLVNAGGTSRGSTLKLRLVGFAPLPTKGMTPKLVDFDYGDDWLEVNLPDWAIATPIAAPAPLVTRSAGLALANTPHQVPGARKGAA
jgi:hypothetical protein